MLRSLLLALALLAVPRRAAAQVDDIAVLARESALRLVARARAAEREGHGLDAEALYLRALETDGALTEAWLGAARLLDARGHRDEARALLRRVPRRALEGDGARIALAQALHAVDDDDHALGLLRDDVASIAVLRARLALCAETGRFPEALAVSRRWGDLAAASGQDAREARTNERALRRLVAEADAVGFAPGDVPLRRLLGAR